MAKSAAGSTLPGFMLQGLSSIPSLPISEQCFLKLIPTGHARENGQLQDKLILTATGRAIGMEAKAERSWGRLERRMHSTKETTPPPHSPGPLKKNLPSCAAESARTPPFSPHVPAALPRTTSQNSVDTNSP